MTQTESPPSSPYRKHLFRRIALARYRSPFEADTPDILEPWRPGLLRTALGVAVVMAFTALMIILGFRH